MNFSTWCTCSSAIGLSLALSIKNSNYQKRQMGLLPANHSFITNLSYTITLTSKLYLFQERDKLMLTRVVIFELVQALKSKVIILESNFLPLISFVLQVRCTTGVILRLISKE